MTKRNQNFLVDCILFILILSFIFTGILMTWILPPGTGCEHTGQQNKQNIISKNYDSIDYGPLYAQLGKGRGGSGKGRIGRGLGRNQGQGQGLGRFRDQGYNDAGRGLGRNSGEGRGLGRFNNDNDLGRGRGLGQQYRDEICKKFLGLDRHGWGDIHFYAAILFLITLILHLYFHWAWIKSFFVKRN